ncbi:MAG: hypothetical protein QOJ40_2846 [Verrucomicrobiota bacterium]
MGNLSRGTKLAILVRLLGRYFFLLSFFLAFFLAAIRLTPDHLYFHTA